MKHPCHSQNTAPTPPAASITSPKTSRFSSLLWLSSRIPKDSSIQKGNIRQRQKCLESQKQDNQKISNVKLSPCVKSKGEDTMSQVSNWLGIYERVRRLSPHHLLLHDIRCPVIARAQLQSWRSLMHPQSGLGSLCWVARCMEVL